MTGIFLGQRKVGPLQGVDPFNITTFSWVLAGFIILVAKSIRVTEWPWRDFLLGRVTCRSLSELHSVTGANEQDIFLYLLTKESEDILITRGPYNKMFMRRGPDGFSIDVKPDLRTLVSSGIIFLKVSTVEGSSLICLDLRGGSSERKVKTELYHSDFIAHGLLMCRYPPRAGDLSQDVELSHEGMYLPIRCRRILGVYHAPDRKFR